MSSRIKLSNPYWERCVKRRFLNPNHSIDTIQPQRVDMIITRKLLNEFTKTVNLVINHSNTQFYRNETHRGGLIHVKNKRLRRNDLYHVSNTHVVD